MSSSNIPNQDNFNIDPILLDWSLESDLEAFQQWLKKNQTQPPIIPEQDISAEVFDMDEYVQDLVSVQDGQDRTSPEFDPFAAPALQQYTPSADDAADWLTPFLADQPEAVESEFITPLEDRPDQMAVTWPTPVGPKIFHALSTLNQANAGQVRQIVPALNALSSTVKSVQPATVLEQPTVKPNQHNPFDLRAQMGVQTARGPSPTDVAPVTSLETRLPVDAMQRLEVQVKDPQPSSSQAESSSAQEASSDPMPTTSTPRSSRYQPTSRPQPWTAIRNDLTFPVSIEQRRFLVRQILTALASTNHAIDKRNPAMRARWFPAPCLASKRDPNNPSYYTLQHLEVLAWRILIFALQLHTRGSAAFTTLGIFFLSNAYKERNFTFTHRVNKICEVLAMSKSRCERLLGGESVQFAVGTAGKIATFIGVNRKQNIRKQEAMDEAREKKEKRGAEEGAEEDGRRAKRKQAKGREGEREIKMFGDGLLHSPGE